MQQIPPYILYLKSSRTQLFEHNGDVKSISLVGKLYAVEFRNGRTYKYGQDKVRYYPLLSKRENVRVYVDGKLERLVNAVYDYGSVYVFTGEIYVSNPIEKSSNIEICDIKDDIENATSTIEYFKDIVACVSTSFSAEVEPEENRGVNQIGAQMVTNALDSIDLKESRTAFANYIDGIAPTQVDYKRSIIYPFGCNESQQMAVERALSSNMSIIEGPPGTGKTQTILNIVANIISSGMNVAVVSNNNSAVHNVQEKLTKGGYGALIASLGNNENRSAFFGAERHLDTFSQYRLEEEELSDIDAQIAALSSELTEYFKKRSRVALLKAQLTEAECELRHLCEEQPLDNEIYTQIDNKFHRKKAIADPLQLRSLLASGKLSFYTKAILLLKYGFYDILRIGDYADTLPIYANYKFYDSLISNIRNEICELEYWLEDKEEQPKLDRLVELSGKLFGAKLSRKYNLIENFEFNRGNYKQHFDMFINRYPLITSSTLSLHTSVPAGFLFDYLIIDESSQVDIIKASICFAFARRIIVVGDSCQLSHIVDKESAEKAEFLRSKYDISQSYNYVSKSILDSLKAVYGDSIPTTLLKEHYRCHPDIIRFCNKRYYNNELVVMTKSAEQESSPFTIVETNIAGSKGNYNQRQIDETERYITENYSEDYSQVGVVSPYRNHANMLQHQLPAGCEADTIHKYQGREKDVIIFNTVAGRINSFIDNPNLINVAVSRAVKEFVIIKPKSMELPHGTNIGDLIRYICYNYKQETTIQDGAIGSVFDLLYKEYNRLFITFASKNSDIGGSPAEVIMHKLLTEILKETEFASIDFVREYYLRDLVKDITSFSDEEATYIRHGSRLDFLLYNKIDRCPILAIEVDGVTYHKNEKQQIQDAKKDSILNRLNLPLLRLATDGHSERERILEKLSSVIKSKD